ncbi:hypothetical protein K435DRAFT_825045 [Dendrothele bispora CBS 962.96]|uniref:GST N-terminal domain-containing protein n=1 Tax=Dendrothele bispora (strain CBS 962.96) TaxID=1314807 RepID=A0A4S8N0K9_DENBC|nr:hypothetical protein K435DRAFT_825045 [Dendrothele bispora CBS 962.96]
MSVQVVLYRYDASPFSWKVDNTLLLKQIPHAKVNVAPVLPRPEITELLGLTYRRIPVLAIGNDIYCDTSLIIPALERRFPTKKGYGTVFPAKKHGASADTGLVKAFARHYADTVLFPLAPAMLPWDKLPSSFIEDRSTLMGPINVDAMKQIRGINLSKLSTHLSLINEQLSDGREWLFDTELPSLADISVHFPYNWLRTLPGSKSFFDPTKFPHAMKWLDHFNSHIGNLKKRSEVPKIISGKDAAKMIASSPCEPYDIVGFDRIEAQRLGLSASQMVSMIPDDTGPRFATTGKLVCLNHQEFTIEIEGTAGVFRAHFPRIGFTAKPIRENKL